MVKQLSHVNLPSGITKLMNFWHSEPSLGTLYPSALIELLKFSHEQLSPESKNFASYTHLCTSNRILYYNELQIDQHNFLYFVFLYLVLLYGKLTQHVLGAVKELREETILKLQVIT